MRLFLLLFFTLIHVNLLCLKKYDSLETHIVRNTGKEKKKKKNKMRNKKRIKAIKSKVRRDCRIEKEFPFRLIFLQHKIITSSIFQND